MNLNDFLIPTQDICRRPGPFDRVVLTSRVRLARNLQEIPFPGKANKQERQQLLQTVKPVIETMPALKEGFSVKVSALALKRFIGVVAHAGEKDQGMTLNSA